ncbi:ead/Ea22-like family protein [Escherichia coli]|nr:ead/Ea22-like family protein [Escherichia coli]HEF9048411.1 ead/Ea22-like family protein [Escherichia coli]
MNKIDYQALREAAEAIKIAATPQKLLAFRMKVTPQVVLALLDERERNQQYIKSRDQENEDIALTVGRLRVELEAAEKRISELEAREVVLPSVQDVHPLGPQSAKIFCEFHRNIINRCADEIRKAGVNVSIKGE